MTQKTRPVDLLRKLAKAIGISLKRVGREATGDRLRRGAERHRSYIFEIDREKLADPDRLNVLESLSRRFAETLSPSELDPVYSFSGEYINNREVIDGQAAPNHDEGEVNSEVVEESDHLRDLATWLESCTHFEGLVDLLELKPFKGNLPLVEKALRYVKESARWRSAPRQSRSLLESR